MNDRGQRNFPTSESSAIRKNGLRGEWLSFAASWSLNLWLFADFYIGREEKFEIWNPEGFGELGDRFQGHVLRAAFD